MKYELINDNEKKLYNDIIEMVCTCTNKCILENTGVFQDIVLFIDEFKTDRFHNLMAYDFIHTMIKTYNMGVLTCNNKLLFARKKSSIIVSIQFNDNLQIKNKCLEIVIDSLFSRY